MCGVVFILVWLQYVAVFIGKNKTKWLGYNLLNEIIHKIYAFLHRTNEMKH